LEGFDFIRMKPDISVIIDVASGLLHEALSDPGKAYALYVYPPMTMPFSREQIAPPGQIETIITVRFPTGTYEVEWIDTKSGRTVASQSITQASEDLNLKSPLFENDIALRVLRR